MNAYDGTPAARTSLATAAEAAAALILDSGLADHWCEGAILPCEMAFFLAACDVLSVKAVIESGRQDGYSTEIFGHWARARGAEITSIDLEEDEPRAQRCRARLAGLPLNLVKGNAFVEVGRAVERMRGRRTAVLIDGPKGFAAMSLMAATLENHVELLALHNIAEGTVWRDWVRRWGGSFHEDMIGAGGPKWAELRRREAECVPAVGDPRALDSSSLWVFMLDDARRKQVSGTWDMAFGLHQPPVVRWCARTFGRDVARRIYGLSFRALGR